MEITIEKIKDVAEMIPGNTVIYKLQDEKLIRIYYSKGVPSLTGYTNEEFNKYKNEDALSFLVPSEKKIVKDKIDDVILKKVDETKIIYRALHKTKGIITLLTRGRFLGSLDGCPIFLSNISVVEQDNEPYKQLTESSNRSIFICDIETNEILYANSSFYKMVHLSESECLGKTCDIVLANIIQCDKEMCFCKKALKNKEVYLYNSPINGRYYEIESKKVDWGCHDAFATFMLDITKQKTRDTALSSAAKEHLDMVMHMNKNAVSTFRLNLTKNIYAQMVLVGL